MAALDQSREDMIAAMRAIMVPVLRKSGFKGSFPHFYRETNGFVSLITVQFSSSGGSFVVELSFARPDRANVYFKPDVPVEKLRVSAARTRIRLGAPEGGDCWFHFGMASYGEARGEIRPVEELAAHVADLVATEGESWWHSLQ